MGLLDEIKALEEQYWKWLRDSSSLALAGNASAQIVTPFLDRDNDQIVLYATRTERGYRLTDAGETIQGLVFAGCSPDRPRIRRFINDTAAAYGVSVDNGELTATATAADFPLRKHMLVQAILEIGDLACTTGTPQPGNVFLDDVGAWLKENHVRSVPGASFQGKSTFMHRFHFSIPASDHAPERFVQALNHITKESAEALMFKWSDIRGTRGDARLYALYHTATGPTDYGEALRAYEIEAFPWSDRARSLDRLTA